MVDEERKKKGEGKHKVGLTLRWEVISISLGVFSLAAISVVVVLVTTKGSDLLSVVALLLAILSLAAQLIVTGVQSTSASRHYRELSALSQNAEVSLKQINARVDALIENQGGHFTKLLESVIDKTVDSERLVQILGDAGVQGTGNASSSTDEGGQPSRDSSSLTERDVLTVAERLRDELSREAKAAVEQATRAVSSERRYSDGRRREDTLMSEGLIRLSTLPRQSMLNLLARIAGTSTSVVYRGIGSVPDWVRDSEIAGLVRKSMLDVDKGEGQTRPVWRLTPAGRGAKDAIRKPLQRLEPHTRALATPFRELVKEATLDIEGIDIHSRRPIEVTDDQ